LIEFDRREPVVLAPGTVCPFNSQNTLFFQQVFPLLYLPATVTFRFTDILRSLVAQPILWTAGLRLGFTNATVRQDRNEHDYVDDFESEVPMYLRGEEATEVAREAVAADETVGGNLRRVYEALVDASVVRETELDVLDAWLGDLETLSRPS
ncbi:MAG TPA: STELLO glycosyltransferase family protein, partial [Gaiellaceae bacterium]|nr:STELLO glycosyltransferase family protein [Gaiellaceae bacterium]